MGQNVVVNSWVSIEEGCPISCEVYGSGAARVLCGDGFEVEIDSEALRELVRVGSEALRDMDARCDQEQA